MGQPEHSEDQKFLPSHYGYKPERGKRGIFKLAVNTCNKTGLARITAHTMINGTFDLDADRMSEIEDLLNVYTHLINLDNLLRQCGVKRFKRKSHLRSHAQEVSDLVRSEFHDIS